MQRQNGKTPTRGRGLWLALLLSVMVASLWGCGGKALYGVSLKYETSVASTTAPAEMRKRPLTVTLLQDKRTGLDLRTVGHVRSGEDVTPVYPMQIRVAEGATEVLRDGLSRAGFILNAGTPAWATTENTLQTSWGPAVLGGTINRLDVTGKREGMLDPIHHYTATADLTLVLADAAKGRILYSTTVQATSSFKDVGVKVDELERQINGVLSEAVQRFVEGKGFRSNLLRVDPRR